MAALGPTLKTGGNMNFRRLKYFVKLADIGSLTGLQKYYIAQPALSQRRLPHWKGELNQQLLIRAQNGALRQQTPEKFSIPMHGPFYVSEADPTGGA